MSPPAQASRKTLVAEAREMVRSCAGANIRLAARRITRFLDARMQETGLSTAQFGLMAHIAAARDDTIGALAERSGLDQSTLSRNLRGLESAGLVEIAVVEKDLRRRAVWLTDEGARRLEAAFPIWRCAHASLSEVIDARAIRKIAATTATLAGAEKGAPSVDR
jgi:DNA-binding MarR family transcriptional regulator